MEHLQNFVVNQGVVAKAYVKYSSTAWEGPHTNHQITIYSKIRVETLTLSVCYSNHQHPTSELECFLLYSVEVLYKIIVKYLYAINHVHYLELSYNKAAV